MARLMLLILLSFWFSVAVSQPISAAQPPSKEQVTDYLNQCRDRNLVPDLITQFGTDFRNTNYRGVDFRGTPGLGKGSNLSHADFSGSDLAGAVFAAVRLEAANFTGADLSDTDFSRANLTDAGISGAFMQTPCRFTGTTLIRANLRNLSLRFCDFSEAILDDADLSGADLREAWFVGASLSNCSFDQARLQFANFDDVRGLTPDQFSQLQSRSQRWQRVIAEQFTKLLPRMLPWLHTMAVCPLLVMAWTRLNSPVAPRTEKSAAVLNILNGLPQSLMLWLLFNDTATTVQLNAGSESAMDVWSTWVAWWPMLLYVTILTCCLSLLNICVFLAFRWSWSRLQADRGALLHQSMTVCSSMATFCELVALAPTA